MGSVIIPVISLLKSVLPVSESGINPEVIMEDLNFRCSIKVYKKVKVLATGGIFSNIVLYIFGTCFSETKSLVGSNTCC